MTDQEKNYRRTINAWCMYDWANSAFVTTVVAAVFPPYFRSIAIRAGFAENEATAVWGYTSSLALLVIALVAPILGAISDDRGGKKGFVAFFAGLGLISTAGLSLVGQTNWAWASLLFIGGQLGFSGSIVFYESFLPHISKPEDVDRVSTRGYALGYLGGGLLLAINALWIMKPGLFGFSGVETAVKASLVSVAFWWGLFSVPFFYRVPEPTLKGHPAPRPIREGFRRLKITFKEIRRYRQLMLFLLAYWLYNDGIGTIIKMSTAYGHEIGLRPADMILALLITQFVGIPCSFLFGSLAGIIGVKAGILLGLGVYTIVAVSAFFLETAIHFYILAILVGLVQGGSQALSRSMFSRMTPKSKSAEFFGFFSTSEKLAGILGPLVFGLLGQLAGHSRLSIISLVFFFILGGLLLFKVDLKAGVQIAESIEAEDRPS